MIKDVIATGTVYSKSITIVKIKYSTTPEIVAVDGILVITYTIAQTIIQTIAYL